MISKKIRYKCGCEYIQYLLKEYARYMKLIEEQAASSNCGRCEKSKNEQVVISP